MAFSFFDRSQTSQVPKDQTMQYRLALKRVMVATLSTGKTLKEKYSKETFEEALKILTEAAEKLESLNTKLAGEKQ